MSETVVIVGAGHAGVQAAASLRDEGFDGLIRLIDAGREPPYQRPPLSKAYMKGEASAESIILRGEGFYRDKAIDLILGDAATGLDPDDRRLALRSGARLVYDHLILATGARARPLPVAGVELAGVHSLRDMADAARLQDELGRASTAVVVGGGFIGLEFAAVAAGFGLGVTVLEAQDRVMQRAVSKPMSAAFQRRHATLGVRIELGAGVSAIHGRDGRVVAVEAVDGRRFPADIVVLGIGVLAEDSLASAAGLAIANGIVVDAALRASEPSILAIGDNNRHPNPFFGGPIRLESVQNALDQARQAARTIVGKGGAYRAIPWFWSDQADFKLQIAGVSPGLTLQVLRGDPDSSAFSVFGYEGERLAVVESVNRPAEHMIARRLIDAGLGPTPREAADPAFDLKALAMRATA